MQAGHLLHVSRDSLHVRRSCRRVCRVNNFVAREEHERVGVPCKGIDGREDALQVGRVVRLGRIVAVQAVFRVIHVEHQVDTGFSQSIHACIMIDRVVHRVDANCVETQLLEVWDVTRARGIVGQRVCGGGRATRLIVHPADVEAIAAVEEGIAFHGDGRQ